VNLSGNTVLITGGSSGIGLELAGAFVTRGNTVLITGTNRVHLDAAQSRLPTVACFESDVADPDAVVRLRSTVLRDFPGLNVIVNNAGIMQMIDFRSGDVDDSRLVREIATNLIGPIRMTTAFLPHLETRDRAAIVNVTSGLAFVPLPVAPVYCATKAGMHSFTESLRVQLRGSNVNVFEVAPPITATHLYGADGSIERLGLPKPMDPHAVAERIMAGMEKNERLICPGASNALRLMSRIAPNLVLRRFGKTVDRLFGQA
jgi:uncharacterized oxidoreductase